MEGERRSGHACRPGPGGEPAAPDTKASTPRRRRSRAARSKACPTVRLGSRATAAAGAA